MKTGYKTNQPATIKGYEMPDMPESFSLDEDDLKQIKTWQVGKTYNLDMTVKLVSQSQDSMDKTMRARFEIVSVQEDDASEED
jgi:hypothetical protein